MGSAANGEMETIQATMEKVARTLPAGNKGRYTVVDLQGTLQKAGGVPGAAVGRPNNTAFSPSRFMADCIHANNEGFGLIFAALWDAYFAKRV